MLGRTDSRARAILLLVAFVVVAGALGVRLAYWQVIRRDDLAAMAVRQSSTTYSVPAKRGSRKSGQFQSLSRRIDLPLILRSALADQASGNC